MIKLGKRCQKHEAGRMNSMKEDTVSELESMIWPMRLFHCPEQCVPSFPSSRHSRS